MAVWNKKNVPGELVHQISERYCCDLLTATILARRGITDPEQIMFYLEHSSVVLHNPFEYEDITDAVDRILDAAENSEKVLIFGDRDVDGVTSTTMLYEYLQTIGIEAQCKLPSGNESYGLSMDAVDNFAKDYGSLIITVDCGISNNAEIAHAADLGIDVIVVDHHNPQDTLPEPAIIVNPKIEGSGYPFPDISGCAVVHKLIIALQFSQTPYFNQPSCLLNVIPLNDAYQIDCLKIENLVIKERFSETYVPGVLPITKTKLLPFLQGQQIFAWDVPTQQRMLIKIFGQGVDFQLGDLIPFITKVIPQTTDMSLLRLLNKSKMLRYQKQQKNEIDMLFMLLKTAILTQSDLTANSHKLDNDFQLATLAAIADIMPLQNENRILINCGIDSMNKGYLRPGLQELFSRAHLLGKRITATDLSWNVIPILNAAGRLGEPETALKLFIEKDPAKRDEIAARLIELNNQRKSLGADAFEIADKAARESLSRFNNNLVLVADERIDRGVTGTTATKLAQFYKVPAIVIAFPDADVAVGSVRSVRGYDVTDMLEQNKELFINHGGHNFAAGFSFTRDKLELFIKNLEKYSQFIEFSEGAEDTFEIDAELPQKYLTKDILKTVDLFEPFGESNPALTFLSRRMKIIAADIIGKTKTHLKLTLSYGENKWPALYWNAVEKLKTEFDAGDYVDVLYQITRNEFNGAVTPQLIITDMHRSES
ncbi:MAG: single-stranded-DNA-specific exonuclease RecJ [Treponema sp.]|nr:single-stranded-DNA-specific exonuclease RecJ [Candidatus Treponema caballi]